MDFLSFLQFAFIQKAFIAGIFIGVLCACLGLFLVLKKMSLIGDGLAHVSFGAVALGLYAGLYPIYVAIPIVLVASYLILKLSEKAKVYGDAAIGIFSSVGIAGGVILAAVSRGFNVDLLSYLFGNILAISDAEIIISIVLSFVVLVTIFFYYYDLFSSTFDEEYAKATGVKTQYVNLMLAALTGITVVLAIRIVGIMLISAMLILPAVTALQIAKGFKGAMVISSLVAVFSVIVGITLSFFLNLPTGATIVIINFFVFLFALVFKKFRG
jgi:zinc transport system permease protein